MAPRATLRVGLAQMTSAATHAPNVAALRDMAARAAGMGCEILALPEVAGLTCRAPEALARQVTDHDADPYVAACREAAARHGLWIHTGSTPVRGGDGGRMRNHSDLIDDTGAIVAGYDKIHLFDVALDGGDAIGESRRFAPGARAVAAGTPWGPMGLTICYDLRFPHLFRDLARAGARVIFVPSAFTVPTGRAHWEVLLRARAIEAGAWVLAPAQVGRHEDGRETWGHSLAVTPWGEVAADLGGEAPDLVAVDLDLGLVEAARRQIPSLEHDRPYELTRAP